HAIGPALATCVYTNVSGSNISDKPACRWSEGCKIRQPTGSRISKDTFLAEAALPAATTPALPLPSKSRDEIPLPHVPKPFFPQRRQRPRSIVSARSWSGSFGSFSLFGRLLQDFKHAPRVCLNGETPRLG